jgi:UDP-N-acetylglucosamine 4,6-dehydratase/UDP-glucose 4-epimerase|tara:strand:- start:2922 stop:3917 length:996 start_codon:yes stop_codon:yes gene_type:complete
MFDGKTVLITGGTGSLGTALTQRLLADNVKQIRIFSRNELKQIEMESKFHDERLRFLVGDIRELPRLIRATEDVDYVFHAAALKHVPKIEYNPFEAIKTNVNGSQNVIDACLQNNVEKAICIGTDKAVSPLNTYGATKLLMEKLFVTAQRYSNPKKHRTTFSAVRYGNVFGSSGSVIPKFIEQVKNNQKITMTDPEMTRFNITMNDALDFILKSTSHAKGTEIFVPKLKSYVLSDIKNALNQLMSDTGSESIGIRPGEKLHESLINEDEISHSYEYEDMYMIIDPQYNHKELENIYPKIKKINEMRKYSSDLAEKLSISDIKELIQNSGFL